MLTKHEHAAVSMLGALYALMRDYVVGSGPTREADLAEIAHLVHGLQRAVMAQAAAREYPRELRLLGEVLESPSDLTPPPLPA